MVLIVDCMLICKDEQETHKRKGIYAVKIEIVL